jgi:hypothetical protein
VIRRAVAAATIAGRPRSGRLISDPDRPPPLTSAGLALIAAGVICTVAVHVHPGGVSVRTVGIIVTALGLAWLWIPVQNKRALLRRQLGRAIAYLAWDPAAGSAVRCSLDELLGSPREIDGDSRAQLSPENWPR